MLLIYDIYGTLCDIHTDESNVEVWRIIKEIIAVKSGRKPAVTPKALYEMYRRRCRFEEDNAKTLAYRLNVYEDEVEIGLETVFADMLYAFGVNPDYGTVQRVMETFRLLSTKRFGYYNDVMTMLVEQRLAGHKLAILSNAQRTFVESELSDVIHFFDYVYISSDYQMKKPAAEFLNRLLTDTGTSPENAVMIGNSAHDDIAMAKKLGLRAIYVDSDIIDEPIPEEADAVVTQNNMIDITGIVEKWKKKRLPRK